MHVCLGVCGIGKGHSSRQYQLAQKFIAAGHVVSIIGYGEALAYFQDQGLPIEEVWVPYFAELEAGFCAKRVFMDNWKKFLPGILRNVYVFLRFLSAGYPDLFISDYEPVSARLAYLRRKPLVLYAAL